MYYVTYNDAKFSYSIGKPCEKFLRKSVIFCNVVVLVLKYKDDDIGYVSSTQYNVVFVLFSSQQTVMTLYITQYNSVCKLIVACFI